MTTSEVGGSKSFPLPAVIGRCIANSTTIKVAAFVTGIGILAFVFFNASVLGTGVIISLSIAGALFTVASSTALIFSRSFSNQKGFVPPNKDDPQTVTCAAGSSHRVEERKAKILKELRDYAQKASEESQKGKWNQLIDQCTDEQRETLRSFLFYLFTLDALPFWFSFHFGGQQLPQIGELLARLCNF